MYKTCNNLIRNRGFTILEVLIAMVIMSVITTSIFELYITQHENYLIQDDITEIQQNVRASIDEIARNVRMAGYNVPDGIQAIYAYNTNPDTIVLTYRVDNCDSYLSSGMPQPSAELKCGTDVSCFEEGQWIYIFEPDSGGGEWFMITQIQEAAQHIQHNTMPLSRIYGKDAIMVSMIQMKFFVDNTTFPDNPRLMMERPGQPPQIYADNITDLQFQYRNRSGNLEDVPALVYNIREVLITVTGRSKRPDPDNQNNPYRIRTFSTSVNTRNTGT